MSNSKIVGRSNQKLTVSGTSVGLTVPTTAQRATIQVRVADVFMETDGSAAATTDSMITAGTVIDLTDYQYELAQFRFISNGVDATLDIWYFN